MAPRSRKIELNTARLSALLRLPRVGLVLARAIMSARPYSRISDLRNVSGVGEKLYFILKAHVTVSKRGLAHATEPESGTSLHDQALSAKLDLNSATVEELAALPGVGQGLAEAMVAGRPYGRLPELQRVSGVGPKLYAALRQHLRVPRAAHTITGLPFRQEGSVSFEEKSGVGSAVEIDSMPSFDEEGISPTPYADKRAARTDPLEVETVHELIGPRIVDGRTPLRIDPPNVEGKPSQPAHLVTRELRRDWKGVEIEIGARPRRRRWRLLGAAVIAVLILSVLQAYRIFGDAIIPSITSSRATDTPIGATQVVSSAIHTQTDAAPTRIVTGVVASTTILSTITERSPTATLQPPTATAKPTIAFRLSPTTVPSTTPVPTATLEIVIPQSVRDIDPPLIPLAVLWMEDFEPIQFPWGYDRNEFWDSGIVDGALRLSMKQRGKLFYSTGPAFHLADRDFLYEGDVIVGDCTGKDYYGLLFKARLPDYYAATITCEGNYRLVRRQDDIYEDLLVAVSDAVPEGPGMYRLGVLLQGDGFSLYVNGTYVDRLPVVGIGELAAGEFGVFARSVESHQMQLEWDNLIATELQS